MAAAARFAGLGRGQHPVSEEDLAAAEAEITRAGDQRVRAAALGALVRLAAPDRARSAWERAAADADPSVRRRAAELTPTLGATLASGSPDAVLALLSDDEPLVAEAAAFAAGEIEWVTPARATVVAALARTTESHPDPLVRESAVAALGALGDPEGLPAILAACSDRPAVRRRAVLALSPHEGPDVDAAIAAARTDADWQVRQAAEDLS